jgi:hypothetical protein
MPVNADAARCRPSLGVNVLVAEGGIGPRPAGTYHQRLEIVLASKSDRDRAVALVVVVHLVTRHGAPSDESNESLCRQRTGIPVPIIARLSFLGSVDAEQANALLAKLHGRHPRPRSHARFQCHLCLSHSAPMRVRPRSKAGSAPTTISSLAPAPFPGNVIAQYEPFGGGPMRALASA